MAPLQVKRLLWLLHWWLLFEPSALARGNNAPSMLDVLSCSLILVWSLGFANLLRICSTDLIREKGVKLILTSSYKVILWHCSHIWLDWFFSPISLTKSCKELTLSLRNWLLIWQFFLNVWWLFLLCAWEKIRFHDDFGLVSSLWRILLDTSGTSAKFSSEWVKRVRDHRILHFTIEYFFVKRLRVALIIWARTCRLFEWSWIINNHSR